MLYCRNCSVEMEQKNNRLFCSQSCAASYNNKHRPKKSLKWHKCDYHNCTNETKYEKFCSQACRNLQHRYQYDEGLTIDRLTMKRYLIADSSEACMRCNNTTWMNRPIPLEVHHIDGNASNNKPINLQLLCPNCHALTPNHKAKNKGSGRKARGLPVH